MCVIVIINCLITIGNYHIEFVWNVITTCEYTNDQRSHITTAKLSVFPHRVVVLVMWSVLFSSFYLHSSNINTKTRYHILTFTNIYMVFYRWWFTCIHKLVGNWMFTKWYELLDDIWTKWMILFAALSLYKIIHEMLFMLVKKKVVNIVQKQTFSHNVMLTNKMLISRRVEFHLPQIKYSKLRGKIRFLTLKPGHSDRQK